jgi:hypothetical protein
VTTDTSKKRRGSGMAVVLGILVVAAVVLALDPL